MENLLTSKDVLIVLHALECLYNMTQSIHDLIPPSRLVPILVNFLTIDISHFGVQAFDNPVVNTYAASLVTNTNLANQQKQQAQLIQPHHSKIIQANIINGKAVIKPIVPTTVPAKATSQVNTSLLHQTLQQQHALNVSANGSPASGLIKINTTAMPVPSSTAPSTSVKTNEDEGAKSTLSNWYFNFLFVIN